jgi:hypothetical protein
MISGLPGAVPGCSKARIRGVPGCPRDVIGGQTEYLLNHIDALLRLSHDVKDRAVSSKLREIADEFRIMISVADITDLAAALNKNAVSLAPDLIGTGAVSSRTLGVAREDTTDQPLRFIQTKYSALNCALVCSKVRAPRPQRGVPTPKIPCCTKNVYAKQRPE